MGVYKNMRNNVQSQTFLFHTKRPFRTPLNTERALLYQGLNHI